MRYKEFAENIDAGGLMRNMIYGQSPFASVSNDMPDAKTANDKSAEKSSDNSNTTASSTQPVDGPVSSQFGSRGGTHKGTDIAVPVGTPIKSPVNGVISRVGSDNMNGNYVVVKSGNEENFFLHLSQIKVSNGQQVKKGEVVGLSGNTGRSTGPHLHWEKHIAGRPVDPMSNVG